jgi:sulfate permease, SulP family
MKTPPNDPRSEVEIALPPEENGQSPQATGAYDWLLRRVPALDSLRTYSLRSLRLDLFAGLTVAAVAVPQAMAYASIPLGPTEVRYGLYTAIVMTAVGALFDSSRQLINGPTNAICIALASAIATVPEAERFQAAVLMAFLVGSFQLAITLFRLGDLTRFISQSVIVGFTLGAAVLLALGQLKNLLGLPAQGQLDDHFLLQFYRTMRRIDLINWHAFGIGLATIFLALVLRALARRLHAQLPELLIVMVLMAGAVWFFAWDQAPVKVDVIGAIPSELPSFDPPTFSWPRIRELTSSALAIAVLGLLEAVAMAKAIAARTHQKLDINQQCLSEGLANLVGSFFQCFPGSGSLTRSALNVQAGAVSQWSGVFAAGAVALTVVAFAPFARYIPRAALAGILLVAAWRLVDRKQLMYHLRTTRFDMQIVLATAISAIAINIEFCILIGVFLSVALYVRRAARLHMTELTMTAERVVRERDAADPRCDRIAIYSLEGELFFGSAPDLEALFETFAQRAGQATRVIVLRLKRVRNPDAVCLELFERFIATMKERGIQLLLCGVRDDFAKMLRVSGLEAALGKENIFIEQEGAASSTLEAVRFAYELLKGDFCSFCPRRGEGEKPVLYYMI